MNKFSPVTIVSPLQLAPSLCCCSIFCSQICLFLFLLHRCGDDDTLVYNYEESAVQQFSLDAFRFMGESAGSVVYLHCAVEACRKGDNSSRCAQGCLEDNNSKRRRRSLVLDSVAQQTVTVGPVYKTTAAPAANGER